MDTLYVKILRSADSLKLVTSDDTIQIESTSPDKFNHDRCDFAAWLFMPIAMKRGMNIHIEGTGSKTTIRNARRMSEIWESWFPERFNTVEVSFQNTCHAYEKPESLTDRDLCFYSGGVDSTYAILRRFQEGKSQSLLTIHGMDYGVEEEKCFLELIRKTSPFAGLVGHERLIVRTNVYDAYAKYKINIGREGHLTHIFALAGAGFLHSEHFRNLVVASDHRLDQQFSRFPYGSNLATNPLFCDGETYLLTESSDASRTERIPLLSSSREALASLTFCTNPAKKPDNCGQCKKCIRTKLMFLAATGEVPDIFIDRAIPENWPDQIDPAIKKDRLFLIDLILYARRNGTLDKIPQATQIYVPLKEGRLGKNRLPRIIDSMKKRFS